MIIMMWLYFSISYSTLNLLHQFSQTLHRNTRWQRDEGKFREYAIAARGLTVLLCSIGS